MGDLLRAVFEREPTDDELRSIEAARKERERQFAEDCDLLKYQEYDCTPFGDVPLHSRDELRRRLEKNQDLVRLNDEKQRSRDMQVIIERSENKG